MKIAIIHPSFAGSLGGAEKVSYEIAAALSSDNEVLHYTEFERGKAIEKLNITDYKDVESIQESEPLCLELFNTMPRFTLLSYSLESRHWEKRIEEIEEKVDLIILTTGILTKNLEIDTPLVVYRHGNHFDFEDISNKNIFYRTFISFFGTNKKLEGDLEIFNSEYTSNKHKEGEIAYPPVDSNFNFLPTNNGEIVYFSRFSPEKKMEDAIEIASRAGKKLTLMGFKHDQDYVEMLKEEAGSNVSFLFDVDREKIKEVLERAQFGINTSIDYEGFGIATVEYMKAGCIPVVRNSGANSETVEEVLLNFESKKDAIETIKDLETSEQNRQKAITYIKSRKNEFSKEVFRKRIQNIVKNNF